MNITKDVQKAVDESGVKEGLVLVNAMNITASVFINDDESGLHQDYEKWLETNQKWLETAGFHTACLWNTTNKERFGRYMQTCGLQGVFDGFENNKERYEVGKDGEGVVCILQGAHCWEEGDVYKDLISVKPNGQKPVFRNVYLIAASYGGVGGYERLIRELQRVESYLPNTYEFLLPMDLCATLKEYIEKNGGNGHE